jgi:hypothetical protein
MEWPLRISKFSALIAFLLILAFAAILWSMGRPPICACGNVKLLHLVMQSSENSQHLADWYTPSHIIHGFIFYGLGHVLRKKWPALFPLGVAVVLAILLEGTWEVMENSPAVIERYREVTISWGYSGDSIANSVADIIWMLFGFFMASRLPWKLTLAIALVFEIFTAWMVRDNLTLNVMMLTVPLESVKDWQAGATGYWVTGNRIEAAELEPLRAKFLALARNKFDPRACLLRSVKHWDMGLGEQQIKDYDAWTRHGDVETRHVKAGDMADFNQQNAPGWQLVDDWLACPETIIFNEPAIVDLRKDNETIQTGAAIVQRRCGELCGEEYLLGVDRIKGRFVLDGKGFSEPITAY